MRSRRNSLRAGHRLARLAVVLWLGLIPALAFGQVVNRSKPAETKKPVILEGNATWYNVPPKSLTKRRAAEDELTAANLRLPLGTKVRVTHLKNGKSVVVRITDRLTSRSVLIDLCKEAAAQLDMLHEGSARVRLEVLPDDSTPVSKTKAASW